MAHKESVGIQKLRLRPRFSVGALAISVTLVKEYGVPAMFRVTIREMLLLTVIAAMAVGWSLDRSRLAEEVKLLRFKEMWRNLSR